MKYNNSNNDQAAVEDWGFMNYTNNDEVQLQEPVAFDGKLLLQRK